MTPVPQWLPARRGRIQACAGNVLAEAAATVRGGREEPLSTTSLRIRDPRISAERLPVAETVRQLSHALMAARHGRTSDDASLLLVEYKGPPDDDELAINLVQSRQPGDRPPQHAET
ncbi:MAG: hypothetical protein ACXV3F_07845 [Frankiaceae bacterium]